MSNTENAQKEGMTLNCKISSKSAYALQRIRAELAKKNKRLKTNEIIDLLFERVNPEELVDSHD